MKNFLLVIALFLPVTIFAQYAEIRGFVYEFENTEPSLYTSVYIENTNNGVLTNTDGFFSLTKLTPGKYTLIITSVGFDTLREEITLKAGDVISKKYYLKTSTRMLSEVQIDAEAEEKKSETRVSVNKVSSKEIKSLPSVGGEPDLAQYLQVLPGVVFSGDQGGQLYIRGGTPIQNKVLLDGMVIYNPFHSIGLFSVFDADLIRSAEIYTGGFNAQYGGRISSIMDITSRDGNKKRFGGKISANTFTSKLILEGPLGKKDSEGYSSSSFLVSGKTSYLDQTSKTLYSYVDTNGLPFTFNDLYAKATFNGSNGSRFSVFGFSFDDAVKYKNVAGFNWNTIGCGSKFVLVPSGSSVLLDGNFAFSKYNIALDEQDNQDRKSEIKSFNFGLNFSYFLGKDELNYGLEVQGFRTDFNFYNAANKFIEQVENTTELATYFKYKKIIKRVILEPGIRLNYYASLAEFSPEPRLGFKYNVTDKFRIKGSAGYYTQNLLSTTSDRDVVNLFYGFLSGTDDVPETFDGKEINSRLQKAQHAIGGIEWDLPFHLNLNIETYIKNFSQLTNINRDKIYDDNEVNNTQPDRLKKDFIIEKGKATGIDFALKYENKKLYIWMVYSLAYSTRFDGIRTYFPQFDRRHNANIVANYSFGKNKSWEAGLRWNLGSPFPFTLSQGYYEQLQFNNGLGSNWLSQNGNLAVYYDQLNKGRLSYFHRLDLTIKKSIKFSDNSNLEINASVTNAYNRENIFYRDRITGGNIFQLPILPAFGFIFSF